VVNANAEQARLTGIESGAAMLHLKRIGYLENGTAIELTHAYFRSDSYAFVAVLGKIQQCRKKRTRPDLPANLALGVASPA